MLCCTLLQSEDDSLIGYPSSAAQCAAAASPPAAGSVLFIRLGVGAHPSFAGERFEKAPSAEPASLSLPPSRAVVLRLASRRLRRQREGVEAALAEMEAFLCAQDFLDGPFEAPFACRKAMQS